MTSVSPLGRRPSPSRSELPISSAAEHEAQANRFAPDIRLNVLRICADCPRFADLMHAFPAAAYRIAARSAPIGEIDQALTLVHDGAPLRDVADVLGLPYWIRRLPPEAFRAPIPPLPGDAEFSRRIGNVMPRSPRTSALWLEAVGFGRLAAGEDFAIWLAGQPILEERGLTKEHFATLAAYAWHSSSRSTRAGRLILVPWHGEMAFDSALCSARAWLNRVRLVLQLKPGVVVDPWLTPGVALGMDFVPLLTAGDLLDEAAGMRNCADQFAERLVREKCRLFGLRRNGERIATLEIGQHVRETGVLDILQLKGRANAQASAEAWRAAHTWLAQQKSLLRQPVLAADDRRYDARTWTILMRPYRTARGGAPWLAEAMTSVAFGRLAGHLAELARRARVTSWLFN